MICGGLSSFEELLSRFGAFTKARPVSGTTIVSMMIECERGRNGKKQMRKMVEKYLEFNGADHF